MAGIYIAVANGEGGKIECENSYTGNSWETSSSSKKGYSSIGSGTSTFTAYPDTGYEFSHFDIYIDTSSENYSSGQSNGTKSDNPLTLSNYYAGASGSYRVRANFVATTQYYTVTMKSYVDGTLYSSRDYQFEEGSSINTQYYADIPSNSRFNYVYYGSQYSYYPTFTVYKNMTIHVYFKGRPSSWSWTSTVAAGYAISLSANEWNRFTARINAFRTYLGVSTYSFTAVNVGTAITPEICNQARTAINEISSYQSNYSVPSALSAGSYPASFFNGLKNVLNAIS